MNSATLQACQEAFLEGYIASLAHSAALINGVWVVDGTTLDAEIYRAAKEHKPDKPVRTAKYYCRDCGGALMGKECPDCTENQSKV